MVFHYSHPEWFEGIDKPVLTPQDKIILWGAGKLGSVVAHVIERQGFHIEAFVDSAVDKHGKTFCGYRIIRPEELYTKYADAIVVVSCAFPIVFDELKRSGRIQHAYDPHAFLLEIDFNGFNGAITAEFASRITENALRNYAMYYGRGFLIERLLFMITDKCSLNCRNCDGYMPFHINPKTDSVEVIQQSYEKIMEACGYVETIDILGGEPLVHSDIAQITDYFVRDKRCGRVMIISNGTIVPNQELVQVLKSPKCTLRISDYGVNSRKKDEIIALCKKEKIRYEVTNYQYWDKIPLIQETNETEEELDGKYDACTANVFYVKHGKLFQCTFVAGLSGLGENLIPNFEKNYIDLLKETCADSVFAITKFARQVHERRHLDACRYCPGSHCIQFEDKQPVAEQANGKLPLELLFKEGKRICD